MQPLNPEEKSRILETNPQAAPENLKPLRETLSERFTIDPNAPQPAPEAEETESVSRRGRSSELVEAESVQISISGFLGALPFRAVSIELVSDKLLGILLCLRLLSFKHILFLLQYILILMSTRTIAVPCPEESTPPRSRPCCGLRGITSSA